MLEEVLDAALAAAEMVEENLAHDSPAQAGAPARGGVDVSDADNAFGNKMIDLPRQSGLEAVGDVARHLLVEADGALAETGIELGCAPKGVFRGLGAANDFDQWHQVRRIEGMADHATLGVGRAGRLDLAHG